MIIKNIHNLDEQIIRILSAKPFVSALQIFNILKIKNSLYSLQAVYKSLKKLQSNDVVVKIKDVFSLKFSWIMHQVDLTGQLTSSYFDSHYLSELIPNLVKKQTWRFNNLFQLNDFWAHLLLALIQQSPVKQLLGWNPHTWFHLIQTEQEKKYIQSLEKMNAKLFLIVGSQNYLNKWASQFWRKPTVEYSFAKSFLHGQQRDYLNIVDDYILSIKLDPKTYGQIDQFYRTAKSTDKQLIALMISIFQSKTRAKISLEKNLKKARSLKIKFGQYFGVKFE